MATNYYDVARLANTMGMKTTIVLDPKQITTRVKNSVKKQLRQGRITGGWRSNAAKIAEHITEKFDLNVVRDTWRGVQINNATREQRERLTGLVNADWAATLLDEPQYQHIPYYRDRNKAMLIDLRSSNKKFHLTFHDSTFTEQARAIMAEGMTAKDKELIEKAIEALDDNHEIHITTYQ